MEPRHFDRLAVSCAAGFSRRDALQRLIAGVGALTLPGAAALTGLSDADAKSKRKHKHKKTNKKGRGKEKRRQDASADQEGKAQDKQRVAAQQSCWRAGACNPGKGANVSRCDLAGYSPSSTLNCTGGNASRANLRKANLSGATFTKANLSGSCLVDVNFTNATFAKNTNLANAIFCRTTMPDGSVNNSGCDDATECCSTCIEAGKACGAGIGGSCCGGGSCTNGVCESSCIPNPGVCAGRVCGSATDACGNVYTCGNDDGACPPSVLACNSLGACDAGSGQCSYTIDTAHDETGRPCGANDNGICVKNPDNTGSCVITKNGGTCIGADPCGEATPPIQCATSNGYGVGDCGCYSTTEGGGICLRRITSGPNAFTYPYSAVACTDLATRPGCDTSADCGAGRVCAPLDKLGQSQHVCCSGYQGFRGACVQVATDMCTATT